MQINLKTNWKKIINFQTTQSYWLELTKKVDEAYASASVFPKQTDIFKCFDLFNFEKTKIVIIGQDPYYNKAANGLAFSVNKVDKIPPSLKNIFKELKTDLGIERKNGDLKKIAKQGVLLLNNALTVESNLPNSHLNFGWQIFTNNIIQFIDQRLNGVVFILWGKNAQQKLPLIINNRNNIIFSSHPSPLSASGSFIGSKPFSRANNILISYHKKPINW